MKGGWEGGEDGVQRKAGATGGRGNGGKQTFVDAGCVWSKEGKGLIGRRFG